MKIEVVFSDKGSAGMTEKMNELLAKFLDEGYMIIDYGIESKGDKGVYGFIKYCDKQFLRDYKIKSIMNEI